MSYPPEFEVPQVPALSDEAPSRTIVDRFEEVVRHLPSGTAVCVEGRRWNYEILNEEANRVAHTVAAHGAPGDGCVALMYESGPELIAAIIGVLKAGLAYLVVPPATPPKVAAARLARARPLLVLVGDEECVPPGSEAVSVVRPSQLAQRRDNPGLSLSPASDAAIFYTSGTTGEPKGVVKSHAAILHRAWIYARNADISVRDRQSLLTDCSLSSSEVDLFGALLHGARLHIFDPRQVAFTDFAWWLSEQRISLLHPPVAYFRRFVAELDVSRRFDSVRVLAFAGDRVRRDDLSRWREHVLPDSICLLRFSSTETGVLAVRRVGMDEEPDIGEHFRGPPVQDKTLSIVDQQGAPLGAGQVGELTVCSRYLASGYWRAPELTARHFWQDADDPAKRCYRTGDLGYLDEAGEFVHQGRNDHLVKVRGHRVSLVEVEQALLTLPDIVDVAVVAEEVAGGMRLDAHMVAADCASLPSVSALRQALDSILMDWQIPQGWYWRQALPLTASGKVDRQVLVASAATDGSDRAV